MKVWLKAGEVEAEIQVRGSYQPDVLVDICHRASELVITQRVTELVVEEADDSA